MEGYDQHQVWLIHNKDRKAGTAANFTVELPGAHHGSRIHSLAVKSVSFTNFFNNVTEKNWTFYYYLGATGSVVAPGNLKSFDLNPGHYTSTELFAALKSKLEAVAGITTVEFALSTVSGLEAEVTFEFVAGTAATGIAFPSMSFTGYDTVNALLGGGGEVVEFSVTDPPNFVVLGGGGLNLSNPKVAYLCCPELAPGHGILTSGREIDLLTAVQLTGGYGEPVHFAAPDLLGAIYYPEHSTDTRHLTFSLRDKDGDVMELYAAHDVFIEMRVIFQRS